ncbi:LysR substrate-binding domain-containing protein [Ottowia sp.]|uniref:LysR family transcriptional regulator n=1 Tax=Ottowia sp. TaxID=1898956 RepID=UPI002CADA27A|nr:LysR substrate-binding domain-containing protein [Ottowia sp.]HRN74373.1 LysR substrate-binding domain-containing protein [Ottowia sp.]HRQ01267.1 LysR substrate-binding domain-containing protein [Ottowia sp.]
MSSPLPPPHVLYARLAARARLRHLQLLVAVAEEGSLVRAAEAVGMSQPAATQAMAELERLLGMGLFERHARGMRATAVTASVLPLVRNILQAVQSTAETMAAVRDGASGLLRVGTLPAVAALLARQLTRLLQRQPQWRVEVVEETGEQLLQHLLGGRLDLALLRQPRAVPARIRFEALLQDEAVVLCGVRHPLTRKSRLALADLAACPWLLPPVGIEARQALDQLFAASMTPMRVHPISTSSQSVLVEVLADQQTLVLAPASLARFICDWGLGVRLDTTLQVPLPAIGVAWVADASPVPVGDALIELLRGAEAGP